MFVTKVDIAATEPILQSLKRTDYADAYCLRFTSNRNISMEEVVYTFFDSAPKWVEALITLRDHVVKLVGLKTISAKERKDMRERFSVEEGQVIGLFKVLSKASDEVIVGEDDKHLNFRVAMQLKHTNTNLYEITFITTVMLHNFLGKVYFGVVKPFHQLVVKAMLRRAVKQLESRIM